MELNHKDFSTLVFIFNTHFSFWGGVSLSKGKGIKMTPTEMSELSFYFKRK